MALNPGPFSRSASDVASGLVDTAAQIFAGAKTFLAAVVMSAGLTVTGLVSGTRFNSGSGSASDVAFGPTGDVDTGIWFPAANTVNVVTNGSLAMQFASTGTVYMGANNRNFYFGTGNSYVYSDGVTLHFGTYVEIASAANLQASTILAHAATTMRLLAQNGSSSSDVCVKEGTTLADGSVHANAKLWSLRTGIGGTETERIFAKKGEFTFWGDFVTIVKWDAGGGNHWEMRARPGFNWELGNNTVTYMGCRLSDGYCFTQYGFEVNPTGSQSLIKLWGSSNGGRIDQRGSDRRATIGNDSPGNFPMGINTLASGATTCTITTSLCTTASHVEITWLADPGARHWVDVSVAGQFTVNLASAPGANKSFSWRISGLV